MIKGAALSSLLLFTNLWVDIEYSVSPADR